MIKNSGDPSRGLPAKSTQLSSPCKGSPSTVTPLISGWSGRPRVPSDAFTCGTGLERPPRPGHYLSSDSFSVSSFFVKPVLHWRSNRPVLDKIHSPRRRAARQGPARWANARLAYELFGSSRESPTRTLAGRCGPQGAAGHIQRPLWASHLPVPRNRRSRHHVTSVPIRVADTVTNHARMVRRSGPRSPRQKASPATKPLTAPTNAVPGIGSSARP